jgi:DNA-binding FadR family transcriptional regulator
VALPKVKDESIVLQKAIAQAIEANDTQRAEEAAQKHMQYIENLLRIYS